MAYKFNSKLTGGLIGGLFAFISQNAGENSDSVDYKIITQQSSEILQDAKKEEAHANVKSENHLGGLASIEKETLENKTFLYQLPKEIDLSIRSNEESHLDLLIWTKPLDYNLNTSCITNPFFNLEECPSIDLEAPTAAKQNIVNDDTSKTISYETQCSTLNAGISENGHEIRCLGGIDVEGDGIKLKLRGTINRDTNPEANNFGLCPEGDITECAGLEVGIEINF